MPDFYQVFVNSVLPESCRIADLAVFVVCPVKAIRAKIVDVAEFVTCWRVNEIAIVAIRTAAT